MTKNAFTISISLYFRILPDSFVKRTKNLKFYNYM